MLGINCVDVSVELYHTQLLFVLTTHSNLFKHNHRKHHFYHDDVYGDIYTMVVSRFINHFVNIGGVKKMKLARESTEVIRVS